MFFAKKIFFLRILPFQNQKFSRRSLINHCPPFVIKTQLKIFKQNFKLIVNMKIGAVCVFGRVEPLGDVYCPLYSH